MDLTAIPLYFWPLYFGVAMLSGAMNSVAGGGTFLTFPVLILSGLSPLAANITSTVALWPGTLASVFAYREQIEGQKRAMLPFLLISFIGSVLGTFTLLYTPEVTFKQLVPWLLLCATLIFTFGRRGIAMLNIFEGEVTPARKFFSICFQLAIAFYGGYFGAGIGILMLAMLQVMGLTHVHQMNALKAFLGLMINGVSVAIFITMGHVIWPVALVMIAGALTGGYFGARLALKVSPEHIRKFVSLVGFSMTAYFFLKGL
jgi:uncharacterized membrane protein YfcA